MSSLSVLEKSIEVHEKQLSKVIKTTGENTDNILANKLQAEFKLIEEIRDKIEVKGWDVIQRGILQINNTINDSMTSLSRSFDNFKNHMEENHSQALIEALENVIHDFNSKIGE